MVNWTLRNAGVFGVGNMADSQDVVAEPPAWFLGCLMRERTFKEHGRPGGRAQRVTGTHFAGHTRATATLH